MTIEEIKQSQKEHKISDKLLCEISGVSVPTWWRYSNGKTNITVNKLNDVIGALNYIIEQKHVLEHEK